MPTNVEWIEERQWPVLAWVARIDPASAAVQICHGSMCERTRQGLVEGVWPGEFRDFAFLDTDLFYGTGIRIIDGAVVFVSSCASVDRMWSYVDPDGRLFVANNLPGLIARARFRLDAGHDGYWMDMESIVHGLNGYRRLIPTSQGRLELFYCRDLVWDGSASLVVRAKSWRQREFDGFPAYKAFLLETARGLGANARSPERQRQVVPFTTISSGYDSGCASLVARAAGARLAATISRARSLIPRSDAGTAVGQALGLDISVHRPSLRDARGELYFWAAMGRPQDMNFSVFPLPGRPAMMFTGFHGDKMWDRGRHDLGEPLSRGDSTGTGLCEWRLDEGFLHVPVPFWGWTSWQSIQAISFSEEMQPWSVGGEYDRPIPRRLLEEEGVPREAFGTRKSATTVAGYAWPAQPQLRRDYTQFLAGGRPVGLSTRLRVGAAACMKRLYHPARRILCREISLARRWLPILDDVDKQSSGLYAWANHVLAERRYGGQ